MAKELKLAELMDMHERAYTHNQTTRQRAADDLLFYWITQWDSALLDSSSLAYKGQFDILRKAGRQIMADLRANPVQIDFEPKDIDRDDGAEILDGLYLECDRMNSSLEAYSNASSEAVVCGFGAWELYTEYETNRAGDKNQVIRRRPIYEANNTAFPDPNAKRLDKSDAKYWSILHPYSKDGYKELYRELTGGETQCLASSFAFPEQSYTFPWLSSDQSVVYVVTFYHRTKVKDVVLTMTDPMGMQLRYLESQLLDDGVMDELLDQGYEIIDEKQIKRWEVKRYVASGEEILSVEVVPGEYIPVVPLYGERAFVEGEEHYEGITRLAKDPQRLRNFQMSYLADIAVRSPRQKPIFIPDQISGYEYMYEESGADNNLPFVYQHWKTAQGEQLPVGPVGYLEAPQVPQAVAAMIELTRQAVEDVANPGLPQDIADPDLSGKAVALLQNRLDQQSMVYQENTKHGKRYDAVVYASQAAQVYDAPRKAMITLPDGSRKDVELMQSILDEETGELKVLNDLTNQEFEVFATVGPSYASKREQTIEQLGLLSQQFAQTDPALQKALLLKQLKLIDGTDLDDIKEYANKQLMLAGIKEPETEEEIAFMQEAMNKPEEPNAEMVYAMAEQGKAQAAQMREQRLAQLDAANVANKEGKLQVDAFRAETDRASVEVDAQKAGADIDLTRVKIQNTQANTIKQMTEAFRGRLRAA
jgi:hypothetical protein